MQDFIKEFCLSPPRLLSREFSPIFGVIKREPEDFEVCEVGSEEPCGSGEHLYCWVEKVGMGTDELIEHFSRNLQINRSDIGLAGMKDRQARTFQWVSVPRSCHPLLSSVEHRALTVHEVRAHHCKLRRGQLKGNDFRIRIRDVCNSQFQQLLEGRRLLEDCGVPNYFGPQRFGNRGKNVGFGVELVRGGGTKRRSSFVSQLAVHSVQSALFNVFLGQRIVDGYFSRVLKGDILWNTKTNIPSVALDLEAAQAQVAKGQLAILGPLMGIKMRRARHVVGLREKQALDLLGMKIEDFRRVSNFAPGGRRALKLSINNIDIQEQGGDPVICFRLPPGGYASAVLNELVAMPATLSELDV